MSELRVHLAYTFDERPGLFGWLWRMFQREEWQESTKFNVAMWLLVTPVIAIASNQLGHGFYVTLCASLVGDAVTYLWCKKKAWWRRQISYLRSSTTWAVVWAVFFFSNIPLSLILIDSVGTMPARFALGAAGIFINPMMFWIRDEIIFRGQELETVTP